MKIIAFCFLWIWEITIRDCRKLLLFYRFPIKSLTDWMCGIGKLFEARHHILVRIGSENDTRHGMNIRFILQCLNQWIIVGIQCIIVVGSRSSHPYSPVEHIAYNRQRIRFRIKHWDTCFHYFIGTVVQDVKGIVDVCHKSKRLFTPEFCQVQVVQCQSFGQCYGTDVRTAFHLFQMEQTAVGIQQEISFVVLFLHGRVSCYLRSGEAETFFAHGFRELKAFVCLYAVGSHVDKVNSLGSDAEYVGDFLLPAACGNRGEAEINVSALYGLA